MQENHTQQDLQQQQGSGSGNSDGSLRHPLAYIHPDAQIAPDVVVEPFATIHDDVVIGAGSFIGSHAVLHPGARLGRNVRIFPGAVVSTVPQDLKFGGEYTTTYIGDGSTIREFATINRGTSHRNETRIGRHALIMSYVHIAHDCVIGDHVIIANAVNIAGHVVMGDYAFIGGMSAVHQFVQIGCHAYISGGSLVRKDVPPYVKAGREPLAFAGANSVGLKRRGFDQGKIHDIQEYYRIIYNSGMNNSQAIDYLREQHPENPELEEVLSFISRSERGIIRGPLTGNHTEE